jgi:hypothetical protein
MENQKIENCIDACQICTDECQTCASECNEQSGMEQCEKLSLACVDACNNLIAASKTSTDLDALYNTCEDACNACATECEKHTDMEHCTVCAEACRKCANECRNMLRVISL